MWEVEYTDEFEEWWNTLTEEAQTDVDTCVGLLEKCGTNLKFPYSSNIEDSRHGHMRELRVQHHGKPYRVLYAFDPRRHAILLTGGNKTGNKKWYKKFVPIADDLYDKHIEELEREKLNNKKFVIKGKLVKSFQSNEVFNEGRSESMTTKTFNTLRRKMSAKARAIASKKTQQLLAEMPLQELRQARHMSQERLADVLKTKQANISRIERRTDMYISTLRSYIQAMGGDLDITARFPEGTIHISQFENIDVV